MENVTQKNHSFNGVRHETMWFPPKKIFATFSFIPCESKYYQLLSNLHHQYDTRFLRKIISHTNKYEKNIEKYLVINGVHRMLSV